MKENPDQPREQDVVLGGQVPFGSLVLGGLENVKRRLASAVEAQRISALSDALKYGTAGLDLVIQALKNESGLKNPNLVNFVAISPDGQMLVSGSYQEIKVWGVRANTSAIVIL
ncbi:WD40 repeat domain-containing protein [Allocoleopsis sp.]|uniref:WD40 repeat domain-containing protein n=1 Tax=Allocoleopsis sp. TaxID=3088169 RepID=UPI002FD0D04F